jgi:hypothetical protein
MRNERTHESSGGGTLAADEEPTQQLSPRELQAAIHRYNEEQRLAKVRVDDRAPLDRESREIEGSTLFEASASSRGTGRLGVTAGILFVAGVLLAAWSWS